MMWELLSKCGRSTTKSPWSCCSRKKREPKPKATPLPWPKILVVCAVIFVNTFGINIIFPFLPFIIHDFFPNLNKTELGTKAGYLGSAYFVGSFTGSLLWGWISDKIGRRPVLLMGMLGTLATELLFGFSQNFAWAIAARFLWGLLNGNLGVAKTYISEVCDDTNQASGFAAVGTTAGLGRLMGAVVGGYLAQPASKFGPLKIPFFCQYPYSLPCIVGGGFTVVSLTVTFLFLEESLHTKKKRREERRDSGSTDCDEEDSVGSATSPLDVVKSDGSLESNDSGIELAMSEAKLDKVDSDTELIDVTQPEIDDDELIMVESDIDTDSDFERVNSDTELLYKVVHDESRASKQTYAQIKLSSSCTSPRACIPECLVSQCGPRQCYGSVKNSLMDSYRCVAVCVDSFKGCGNCRQRKWTPGEVKGQCVGKLRRFRRTVVRYIRLILDRRVFISTFLYGSLAFLVVMCNELVPLLLVTDHDSGGYDMDDSEIGVVLMSVAVLQLLWQALVFPRIAKCLGYRYTFLLGVLLFGTMSLIFPFSNKITGPITPTIDDIMSINLQLGSGSGSGVNSSTTVSELVGSHLQDFCGNNETSEVHVNENSVKRVPVKVWLTLMTIVGVWISSRVMAFTSVMVFISNSSFTETRGTVNGFGQALCAIGRSLGPIIGAPVFAWSENTGKGWPLNHHFVFDMTAVGVLVVAFLSLLLPKTIEKKRLRTTQNTSEQALVEHGHQSS